MSNPTPTPAPWPDPPPEHPPDAGRIRAAFDENFRSRGELGASVSVWWQGREWLTLHAGHRARGGPAWDADTLAPVYSATKGPSAATLLVLLERAGMSPATPVADIWEDFGQGGKAGLTVGELLSHQAGVPALDEAVSTFDRAAVVRALEEQSPQWRPGFAHGYHARTWGFIVDELARRLTGGDGIGSCWREIFGGPLGLDFWIGLPASEGARVAVLYPGRMRPGHADNPFFRAFQREGTLTRRAFTSPRGLHAIAEMNRPGTRSLGLPAMGGIGSAAALAMFYGLLAAGAGAGAPVSEQVLEWMGTPLADGDDLVLLEPTAFTAGFMCDPTGPSGRKLRADFGPSPRAFGHPGAGGSLAFADPGHGIGFAYVMNQMEIGALPGARSRALVEAVYGAGG